MRRRSLYSKGRPKTGRHCPYRCLPHGRPLHLHAVRRVHQVRALRAEVRMAPKMTTWTSR